MSQCATYGPVLFNSEDIRHLGRRLFTLHPSFADYIKSCASLEVCRLIVVAFDGRGFNKISHKEFKDLICSIKFWQSVFKSHTKEKTGILKCERLRDALQEVGFQLPPSIVIALLNKHVRKDGTLRFGDFVAAILTLAIAFGVTRT